MISRKADTCTACGWGEVWYAPGRFKLRLCADHARIVDGVSGWRCAGVQDEEGVTGETLREMKVRAQALAERGSTHEVRHAARVILGQLAK